MYYVVVSYGLQSITYQRLESLTDNETSIISTCNY